MNDTQTPQTVTATATTDAPTSWPTKPCTRCGGTGHYSYNSVDGTVCYGCSGSGRMFATKAVGKMAVHRRAVMKAAQRPSTENLVVGDKVWVIDGRIVGPTFSDRRPKGGHYVEVTAVAVTPRVVGWSGPDRAPTCFERYLTLADGTVHRMWSQILCRLADADAIPTVADYLAGRVDLG